MLHSTAYRLCRSFGMFNETAFRIAVFRISPPPGHSENINWWTFSKHPLDLS